jgi:hypothetical protein
MVKEIRDMGDYGVTLICWSMHSGFSVDNVLLPSTYTGSYYAVIHFSQSEVHH